MVVAGGEHCNQSRVLRVYSGITFRIQSPFSHSSGVAGHQHHQSSLVWHYSASVCHVVLNFSSGGWHATASTFSQS
eukprot:SAG22_NODE_1425_length_4459_cov_5.864220_7_plen_76_part_00